MVKFIAKGIPLAQYQYATPTTPTRFSSPVPASKATEKNIVAWRNRIALIVAPVPKTGESTAYIQAFVEVAD